MQEKIDLLTASNTALRNQIDNANQTAAIEAYVSGLVNPIAKEVNEIKACQPATVSVQYPNLSAVPTAQLYGFAPNSYGYYGSNGYWY